jgi:hypothetical protein
MARYRVRSNGCGGARVVQRRHGRDVQIGGECSHWHNAEIKAARLNGERDPGTDWTAFYGA